MKNSKITNFNPLLNEVKINLNVFCVLILNSIGTHIDSTGIITIYQHCMTKRGTELLEELV